MKNKHVSVLAASGFGVISGALIAGSLIKSVKYHGVYISKSAYVAADSQGKTIHGDKQIILKLATTGEFNAQVFLSRGVGFTTYGLYQFKENNYKLTLTPSYYKELKPKRQLSTIEQLLISKGIILLGDDSEVFPIDKDRFLLVRSYAISYFCAKERCGSSSSFLR